MPGIIIIHHSLYSMYKYKITMSHDSKNNSLIFKHKKCKKCKHRPCKCNKYNINLNLFFNNNNKNITITCPPPVPPPIPPTPSVLQQVLINPGPMTVGSQQGFSVSLNMNGTIVAIGSPFYNNLSGVTYIYRYNPTSETWITPGEMIISTDTGPIQQGYSVSLSNDGNTLAIGAPYYMSTGITYIFTYNDTTKVWKQVQRIIVTTEGDNATAGLSISLAGDGFSVLIGAPGYNGGVGGAWLLFFPSESGSGTIGNFLEFPNVTQPLGAANFGSSVSLTSSLISPDEYSYLMVVGGPTNKSGVGATWIFSANGVFQELNFLVGPDMVGNANQGSAVAISGDGLTVASTGPLDNGEIGATWVSTRTSADPTTKFPLFVHKLVGTASVNPTDQGASVSLSMNGTVLAIGAPFTNNGTGCALVFTRASTSTIFTQPTDSLAINLTPILIPPPPPKPFLLQLQGVSVALSGDGRSLAVGASLTAEGMGAVSIFVVPD
jgi:hypothetical protein